MMLLSSNTQAILLLTAPLIVGKSRDDANLLSLGEYNRLARHLRKLDKQPSDFMSNEANALIDDCHEVIKKDRLKQLLSRGFQLSQAVEYWQTRAIWVISRADSRYPKRYKDKLKEDSPPILYGCGSIELLDSGGLSVVGSRKVDDTLIQYTEEIGKLAARSQKTLISGGAKGIDQAAMKGALDGGGRVVGVLADSLETKAMNRDNRNYILEDRLLLISPYDPKAGFNVGNAMQRNKLIYALSDAALVVNSDYQKGGTWAGAVEQLEKYCNIPVYVRSEGEPGKGLLALRELGAKDWANPKDPESFVKSLAAGFFNEQKTANGKQEELPLVFTARENAPDFEYSGSENRLREKQSANGTQTIADDLFSKVRELLMKLDEPKTVDEVAIVLNVQKGQAKEWLNRLTEEGTLKKLNRPVRFVINPQRSIENE